MNILYAYTLRHGVRFAGVGHSGLDYMHFELSLFLLKTPHARPSWLGH